MSGPAEAVSSRERCAPWARATDLQPGGTAVQAPGGVLLVEWPLPWPRDLKEVTALAEVAAAATAQRVRPLLVTGPVASSEEATTCFYRPRPTAVPGAFRGYEALERVSRPADVAASALALLAGDGEARSDLRDVVICTHGRRDVCCGSLGTMLHRDLRAVVPVDVRLWRSSHQGGHRYAPTALVLPDATSWAFLDVETVLHLLDRDVDVAGVLGHYRGSVGLASSEQQALEAVAFAERGWAWLDTERAGRRAGDAVTEIVALDGSGAATDAWRGVVAATARSGPTCGTGPGTEGCATSIYEEWVVQAYTGA